jgi:hypothetical protein
MAHELCHKAQLVLWIQVIFAEVVLDETFKKLDEKGGYDSSFYWFANRVWNRLVTRV